MKAHALASTALAATLLAACNAILGIDPPNVISPSDGAAGGDGAVSETGTSDGGAEAQADASADVASDAMPDPPPAGNLIENPTMETSCAGAVPQEATVTWVANAHSGVGACQVCSKGGAGTSVYGVAWQVGGAQVTPGKTYVGAAWIRLDPARPSTSLFMPLVLDTGGPTIGGEVPCNATSTAWGRTVNEVTYSLDGGAAVVLEVINRNADDGCFFVDDVTLAPK